LKIGSASKVVGFVQWYARRSYGLCAILFATLGASSAFAQVPLNAPNGQVNVPYGYSFSSPIFQAAYGLLSGTLPPGLELKTFTTLCGPINSAFNTCTFGNLSGTPTTAGTYNFQVIAGSSTAGTTIFNFVIAVSPAAIPPAQLASNVPTLSQWALIVLAMACVVLVRRRLKH
jgi:Putative Ig domain/IPTL-CTERM motif